MHICQSLEVFPTSLVIIIYLELVVNNSDKIFLKKVSLNLLLDKKIPLRIYVRGRKPILKGFVSYLSAIAACAAANLAIGTRNGEQDT